jgi:hypothetical protein
MWVLNHDGCLIFLISHSLCLVRVKRRVFGMRKILTGSGWDQTHDPQHGRIVPYLQTTRSPFFALFSMDKR